MQTPAWAYANRPADRALAGPYSRATTRTVATPNSPRCPRSYAGTAGKRRHGLVCARKRSALGFALLAGPLLAIGPTRNSEALSVAFALSPQRPPRCRCCPGLGLADGEARPSPRVRAGRPDVRGSSRAAPVRQRASVRDQVQRAPAPRHGRGWCSGTKASSFAGAAHGRSWLQCGSWGSAGTSCALAAQRTEK